MPMVGVAIMRRHEPTDVRAHGSGAKGHTASQMEPVPFSKDWRDPTLHLPASGFAGARDQ